MAKHEITAHIVKTAGALFYKNGYNSTGINQIIEKAGIAKATLYSHFKSKEDICIAYLQERHNILMPALAYYTKGKAQGRAQLLGVFDFLRDFYREDDFYGCWAIKTFCEIPPQNEKILATIQQHKKELLLFLGELVHENLNNISKAEVEKISSGLYMLYESAITESHLHKSDWPIHMARSIAPSLFQEFKVFA